MSNQAAGKFNYDGPGAFGHNACAKCHTKVDVNGLDLDNRKHFDTDGGCGGFAQAERIEALMALERKYIFTIEARHLPSGIQARFEIPADSQFEAEAVLTAALPADRYGDNLSQWQAENVTRKIS